MRLLALITLLAHLWLTRADDGFYDSKPIEIDKSRHETEFFTFVTRPDLDAPRWDIQVYNESAVAPGYWFISPYGIVEQVRHDNAYVAPHIYDGNGDLIWSGAKMFKRFNTFTFKTSEVHGERMLTLLYPREHQGRIIDNSYTLQATVALGGEGYGPNMHEFQIVDDGTRALFLTHHTSNTLENANLVGYTNGTCRLAYQRIEERDIKTGDITFEWSAGGSIAVNETKLFEHDPADLCTSKEVNGADYLHLNSVEKLPDGDYLVSSRHTDGIYKISKKGEIVWRLGGKNSDFTLPKEVHWSGQHDVRCRSQNSTHLTLTIFDNAKRPGWPKSTNPYSRGLLLAVNTELMTVEILSRYPHPNKGAALERGNFQTLPNGNALLFWTNDTLNSEYTPDGTLIKTAKLRSGLKTYRGYKFEWTGRPAEPPAIHSAVEVVHGALATVVHVSWNGATEVASWNLYKYDRGPGRKLLLRESFRTGFETRIVHPGYARSVIVEGVDEQGEILGESSLFTTRDPDLDTLTPVLRKELRELKAEDRARAQSAAWSPAEGPDSSELYQTFGILAGVMVCFLTGMYAQRTFTYVRSLVKRGSQWKYSALPAFEQAAQ